MTVYDNVLKRQKHSGLSLLHEGGHNKK